MLTPGNPCSSMSNSHREGKASISWQGLVRTSIRMAAEPEMAIHPWKGRDFETFGRPSGEPHCQLKEH